MKILIVYESITGNTLEIANAIYEALKSDHNVEILNVVDALEKDNPKADLYFLGSWINRGSSGNLINQFANTLKNENVALFGTAGYGDSEDYFKSLTTRFASNLDKNNEIYGSFFSQGKMREVVRERYIDLLKEHPEDQDLEVKIDNFDKAKSHPTLKDLNLAKKFAHGVVEKVNN